MSVQIPVILIDDQQLIREAWKLMLNNDPRFHVVAQYNGAKDVKEFKDAVILFNINKPPIEGQWEISSFAKDHPSMRIIAVSEYNEVRYVKQLLQSGITGFVTKTSSFDELMSGIVQVSEGKCFVSEDVRSGIEIDRC